MLTQDWRATQATVKTLCDGPCVWSLLHHSAALDWSPILTLSDAKGMHEMSPKAESRSIKLTDLPFDCLALIHEYLSPLGPRGEAEPTLPVWARLYSQAARDVSWRPDTA